MLSNCLAADHTMWASQIDWLVQHNRPLLYDTRGHGRSDAPAWYMSLAGLVADVVAIKGHHRIEKAALLALPTGGMTDFSLALGHPEGRPRFICCGAAHRRAQAPRSTAEPAVLR